MSQHVTVSTRSEQFVQFPEQEMDVEFVWRAIFQRDEVDFGELVRGFKGQRATTMEKEKAEEMRSKRREDRSGRTSYCLSEMRILTRLKRTAGDSGARTQARSYSSSASLRLPNFSRTCSFERRGRKVSGRFEEPRRRVEPRRTVPTQHTRVAFVGLISVALRK